MAMEYSYNQILEHVELNNMILGAKGWGVISGLGVTQRAAGANMSVDVAAGTCYVNSVLYTESSVVNVVIAAADATNPRKDLIVYDTSAGNPAAVTGTPAAIPIPPDIPSGDILLALVDVAANDTTIDTADITDKIIIVERHGWMVDGTLVLDTTTGSNAWTDIDLSSYVGSNRALVYLKIQNTETVASQTFAFRENGDACEFYDTAAGHITMISAIDNSECGYTIVPTDSSGVIEYRSSIGNGDFKIWLVGYVI